MNIAIIGGGVSGIISAIELGKDNSNRIDIYEKNSKLGRKILASGNGRCNITNSNINKDYYNNPIFASNILLSYKEIKEYLNNLGLLLTNPDEEGRVYPISYNSNTVMDCLLDNINNKNTNIFYDYYIDNIIFKNNKYIINNKIYDKVIVSIGSMADEKQIHNKLELSLNKLGYKYTNIYPSLSSLPVKENIKSVDGVRTKCNIKMIVDDQTFSNSGELIFKKYEISGIVVMELSHKLNIIRRNKIINNVKFIIDLLPEESFSYNNHNFIENKYNKTKSLNKTLDGVFVKKLNNLIIDRVNKFTVDQNKVNQEIRITSKSTILNNIIHNFELHYDFSKNPSSYHVISGGINLKDINTNLESKKHKGLYFGGEVIDIDGDCGGYNISFSLCCGLKIAKSIMGDKYEK